MRLEHQFKAVDDGSVHRLIDLEKTYSHVTVPWTGYRTPATWEHSHFDETRSYYIAVTDYYKGSNEFPDPNQIYYVCGCPEKYFEWSKYVMLRNAWRYLEIFVESIPMELDTKTPLERLKDFHAFLGKMIEDKEKNP